MTTQELDKLLKDGDVTIERVINRVIQLNGIIGVGLISLGDYLKDYCHHHYGYKKGLE